jgi:hypothetical protein
MAFEEPHVIAKFDRSYGDKKEELRLERGEYQGKPTFTLGLYWLTPDGSWRWSVQKPSQSGKTWQRFHLKAKELEALGHALVAAANDTAQPDFRADKPRPEPLAATGTDDDIPF